MSHGRLTESMTRHPVSIIICAIVRAVAEPTWRIRKSTANLKSCAPISVKVESYEAEVEQAVLLLEVSRGSCCSTPPPVKGRKCHPARGGAQVDCGALLLLGPAGFAVRASRFCRIVAVVYKPSWHYAAVSIIHTFRKSGHGHVIGSSYLGRPYAGRIRFLISSNPNTDQQRCWMSFANLL